MKYKSLATFEHDELGRITKGQDVEATPLQAGTPLAYGYFEPYETKVVHQEPAKPARKAK
jgi:hypothetical protein